MLAGTLFRVPCFRIPLRWIPRCLQTLDFEHRNDNVVIDLSSGVCSMFRDPSQTPTPSVNPSLLLVTSNVSFVVFEVEAPGQFQAPVVGSKI